MNQGFYGSATKNEGLLPTGTAWGSTLDYVDMCTVNISRVYQYIYIYHELPKP